MTKKPYSILLVLVAVFGFNGVAKAQSSDRITARFYGSSTLLIDDGATQILIDGFFSRQSHLYFGFRYSPEQNGIAKTVRETGVCFNIGSPHPHPDCASGPRLKLILPVHGHYDHALDVGVLALWSGVETLVDPSISAVIDATERLSPSALGIANWKKRNTISMLSSNKTLKTLSPIGDFNVYLYPNDHLRLYGIPIFPGETNADLKFPASLRQFRLGNSVNVIIEHSGKRTLILPSAGSPRNLNMVDIDDIDTLFLGIGGLDLKSRRAVSLYMRKVLDAIRPKTAYLIHWDSDRAPFDFDNPKFLPSRSKIQKTLKQLSEFAGPNLNVLTPPAIKKFALFE